MILTYRILVNLFYPFLICLIYLRKLINKEDPIRYREKIFTSKFNVNKKKNNKLLWFHAASIGELKSIIPIIIELNKSNQNLEFLITTLTLSSGNIAEEELKKYNNIHHRFFPLDVNFLVNNFLSLWKPDIIFLVDSEIWPNLILNAGAKKIPLILLNARITKKTFKRWKFFPKTAEKIFSFFKLCLVSNLETKEYLEKFKAKNVSFNGNLKLINQININKTFNMNKDILIKKRFWVAASTHKGEELFCVNTHIDIKKRYNDILTIIAPRHISRVKDIKFLCESKNLKVQILNSDEKIRHDKEIVIINSFGDLNSYFKYAKSVFIGKSTLKELQDVSGQNPIEASKLGCKVYHGPYVYNFIEIYNILEKLNISKKVIDHKDLSQKLIEDLKNSKKDENANSKIMDDLSKKTLDQTMNKINGILKNEIN